MWEVKLITDFVTGIKSSKQMVNILYWIVINEQYMCKKNFNVKMSYLTLQNKILEVYL